jgi:hypothetical protein
MSCQGFWSRPCAMSNGARDAPRESEAPPSFRRISNAALASGSQTPPGGAVDSLTFDNLGSHIGGHARHMLMMRLGGTDT